MDIQRAQEIAESADMKRVTHDGIPVYIQHVDEDSGTARVFPLNQPESEQSVNVKELKEEA